MRPEGKGEPNIIYMRKSYRTSPHGTQNVKTHNRTTQETKQWATRIAPKNHGWTQVLAKGRQFLLLIRHPSLDEVRYVLASIIALSINHVISHIILTY